MKRAKKKNSNPLRWWKFIGGIHPPGGNKSTALVDTAAEATVFASEQAVWDSVDTHAVPTNEVEIEDAPPY